MQLTELEEFNDFLVKKHRELIDEVFKYAMWYVTNHTTIQCFENYKNKNLWKLNFSKVSFYNKQIEMLRDEQYALVMAFDYCAAQARSVAEIYKLASKEYVERIHAIEWVIRNYDKYSIYLP